MLSARPQVWDAQEQAGVKRVLPAEQAPCGIGRVKLSAAAAKPNFFISC